MKQLKFILTNLLVAGLLLAGLQVFAQKGSEWVAPPEVRTTVNPFAGDEQLTQDGKVLFEQLCLVCHGKKGKGDGIGGMSLNPKPSNFTKPAVQAQTDGELFWKLTTGRSPMAPYETVLDEKQRWSLINYIRTFKK